MAILKTEISLIISLIFVSTVIISFSGCVSEDCSNCTVCTGCDIGINSTEEAKLFDELTVTVKNYIAEKENITDQSTIQTSITFKSKDEAFVTVDANGKTWNGTWLCSNGEWNPGSDFNIS
jgi:hypothetical protein